MDKFAAIAFLILALARVNACPEFLKLNAARKSGVSNKIKFLITLDFSTGCCFFADYIRR
jgi:hypothetical protein